MKTHEVSITGFEFNMSGWMTEKACNSVEATARAIEALAEMSPAPLRQSAEVRAHLSHALWDGTKLWAAGCGADWSIHDRDLVLKRGMAGFRQLFLRYMGSDFVSSREVGSKP